MVGRVENGFLQLFRPNTAVFKNTESCLDVKDGIILLVLLYLLCMACAVHAMLGVRTKLGVVQAYSGGGGKKKPVSRHRV